MGNRIHRRANKIAREREVRTLCKEYYSQRHWRFMDTTPHTYIPLEEPIFWGYRRYFVLKDTITSDNKAHRWLSILKVIQNMEDCTRKDFRVRDRREKKWVERPHQLKTLSSRQLIREIPSRWHCYFGVRLRNGRRRFYFRHPQLFESRRTKVYITHRLELNREFQRRQGFLEDVLQQRQYHERYLKISSRKKNGWDKMHVSWETRIESKWAQQEIEEGLLAHYLGEIPSREIEEDFY